MKKDNKNILCATSSGYSSVMMAIMLKDLYPDHNIINCMSNVSKETPESLKFMNECDEYFGLDLIWIETIWNERGTGVGFEVKKYKDLKTKGEIYEMGIQKLGIPSKINPWCNRDMKTVPMKKFADEMFSADNYSIAIGIRADEMDRISESYKTNNIFYPLIDEKISSIDRNKFWDKQPIKIEIPAFKGNCELCFKKSKRKLMTIIKQQPSITDWWLEMESKYSNIEIEGKDAYNSYIKNGGAYFNRSNQSLIELIADAKLPFRSATDEYIYENDLFDDEDSCGSSCSAFA